MFFACSISYSASSGMLPAAKIAVHERPNLRNQRSAAQYRCSRESHSHSQWESHGNPMGMGMTPIPMGICSHRHFSECKLQYSVRTCGGELWLAATALKSHIGHTGSCVFQPRRRQANAFSALPAGCSRNAEQTWALTLQTACCFYTAICRYKRRLRL